MHYPSYVEEEPLSSGRLAIAEQAPQSLRGRSERSGGVKILSKVLVVDDEPDILFLLRKRLECSGYEVIVAPDGVSATRLAIQHNPDVIILDIGMPCGDGHTVAGRIRANVNTAVTPIIFLTARTSMQDKNRACQAGAFAYVTKPFVAEELVGLVDQALSHWE